MGAWTVRLLHGALHRVGKAGEGGKMVRRFSVKLQLKVLHKVLRVVALHSIE